MNLLGVCAIGLGLLVIAAVAGIYFWPSEPLSLTMSVNANPKTVTAGDKIQAAVSISSNKPASVVLSYSLVSKTGQAIISGTQNLEVSGSASRTISITIPPTQSAGSYWLRTKVISGSASTVALSGLIVKAKEKKAVKPVEKPVVLGQSNQSALLTPISPIEPKPVQVPVEPIQPKPSGQIGEPTTPVPDTNTINIPLSADEVISNARNEAGSDPTKAKATCATLKGQDKDTCHSEIASAARDPAICGLISDVPNKDACLAGLALAGDFTVCDDITNEDIRGSCNALKGKTE